MYVSPFFKNDNLDEVRDFIREHSFGILVSQAAGKITATHIPLELDKNEDGKDILTGHISRGNPQWKNFTDDTAVMAIFQGPHDYISSSWYNFASVPTWNYIAVHVYGNIRIIEGEKLLAALKKLVDKYEKASAHPVSVEHMPEQLLHKEIKGIVGFEIAISEIQSAYKLSQNRDAINHQNIVTELEKKPGEQSHLLAAAMKQHQRK